MAHWLADYVIFKSNSKQINHFSFYIKPLLACFRKFVFWHLVFIQLLSQELRSEVSLTPMFRHSQGSPRVGLCLVN